MGVCNTCFELVIGVLQRLELSLNVLLKSVEFTRLCFGKALNKVVLLVRDFDHVATVELMLRLRVHKRHLLCMLAPYKLD